MTVLAQVAIKDAAKCDMHCDLQISVNKLASERIVQLWDMPKVGLGSCLVQFCTHVLLQCALAVSVLYCLTLFMVLPLLR